MPVFEKIFERALTTSSELIIANRKVEITEQGHQGLGKGLARMRFKVTVNQSGSAISNIYVPDYFGTLHTGVDKSRIPYKYLPRHRGGRSRYIEALQDYGENYRGISPEKSLRFAFAVARTHEKEGNPTRNSYRYARNGRRKNWITHDLPPLKREVEKILRGAVTPFFEIETSFRNL